MQTERKVYGIEFKRELVENGAWAFPGNGVEALSDDQRHIRELEVRLRQAELDRDILKRSGHFQ